MEEWIGGLWHKTITRAANRDHTAAAVTLDSMRPLLATLFRAFGGDPGLVIKAAAASDNHARRGLLQRIAGSETQTERMWLDDSALYLPQHIASFAEAHLNQDLYLWLTLLASQHDAQISDWFTRNRLAAQRVLHLAPAWRKRYLALVEAELLLRAASVRAQADEHYAEQQLRAALLHPERPLDGLQWPEKLPLPQLWSHPFPPRAQSRKTERDAVDDQRGDEQAKRQQADDKRRRGEQARSAERKSPMAVFFRAESILSWAENIAVDRPEEDSDDDASNSDDLDCISVSRDNKSRASRVRFDLDLPSAAEDDLPLRAGLMLPEWDYRREVLQADFCRVEETLPRDVTACALPDRLQVISRQIRRQFQALRQSPAWQRQQENGDELDLDATTRFFTDRQRGIGSGEPALFQSRRQQQRELACLLLADLSRSTEVPLNEQQCVIDVVRDSLFLFSEALQACGDRFALYGFSSRQRDPVRITPVKRFNECYSAQTRGVITALKPGYYTRLGAAIRYATRELQTRTERQRLLLILSDGKPNDLDQYEGRYGIEDTRHAIRSARELGLTPYCLTIDRDGGQYLPHLFGKHGYSLIRNTAELPTRLLELYVQLTR